MRFLYFILLLSIPIFAHAAEDYTLENSVLNHEGYRIKVSYGYSTVPAFASR